jgi:hypothetical protein
LVAVRDLQGKTVISIMGGHGMSRSSDIYCNVTKLAWRLAREGFLMVTGAFSCLVPASASVVLDEVLRLYVWWARHRSAGGGPGAMEAANMGAYLKNRAEAEVDEALSIVGTGNDVVAPGKEFTNVQPALNVIERFGPTTYMPRYVLHTRMPRSPIISTTPTTCACAYQHRHSHLAIRP